MPSPFLYDFKRSFLRLSVLLTLALFIAGGVGLGFFTMHSFGITQSSIARLNVVYYTQMSEGNITIIGIVFNNHGTFLSGVTVQLVKGSQIMASTVTVNGIFKLRATQNIPQVQGFGIVFNPTENISIKYNGMVENISYLPFGLTISTSQLYYYEIQANVNSSSIYIAQFGDHLIIFSTNDTTLNLKFYSSSMKQVENYTIGVKGLEPVAIKMIIPNGAKYLSIYADRGVVVSYKSIIYPYTLLGDEIVNAYPTMLSLYGSFFPFVAIYIAYTTFSSPRSKGSLEFLLSKPLTKRELFFNRFSANLVTIFLASVITNLVAFLILTIYIGIPPAFEIVMIETIYLFAYIGAFVSLAYMTGGISKTSGLSIAVPITMFFIFTVIPILTFLPNWTIYLTPSVLGDYIDKYIESKVPMDINFYVSQQISLVPATVSAIAWILVPVIIGYIAFKKKDI
ncbi:ABC transporter permease [Sulfurisphaera tokodaii]|uniref:ABC transporter permease protein n=2 Tax=Sulfurisphaera tokodaii TaxID=111955 RepID=F9VNK3_SULTO|nr:ABC transporter permease subunit [Sulfurisphaera tokodaii]BAK54649.1 hypothetical protein STK_17360 [Sulfurisphaera tokodaii str. 7]HII73353.1 ABC transporter permease subunit [Sulfurisphaera tokodaii]